MAARSAECRCESNFTCGHCLRNAKPCHYTLAGGGAIVGDGPGFRCTPGSIATEHAAEVLALYVTAGAGVAP